MAVIFSCHVSRIPVEGDSTAPDAAGAASTPGASHSQHTIIPDE